MILTIALAILGLYQVSRDGRLLSPIANWLNDSPIHPKYLDPIINCPLCMSSLWGLAFSLGLLYLPEWGKIPINILAVAGTISIIKIIIDYYAKD